MAKTPISKLVLICEVCGYETEQLFIKKRLLYCKDCAEAKERRDRFKREEAEWNRAVSPKDTKPE